MAHIHIKGSIVADLRHRVPQHNYDYRDRNARQSVENNCVRYDLSDGTTIWLCGYRQEVIDAIIEGSAKLTSDELM